MSVPPTRTPGKDTCASPATCRPPRAPLTRGVERPLLPAALGEAAVPVRVGQVAGEGRHGADGQGHADGLEGRGRLRRQQQPHRRARPEPHPAPLRRPSAPTNATSAPNAPLPPRAGALPPERATSVPREGGKKLEMTAFSLDTPGLSEAPGQGAARCDPSRDHLPGPSVLALTAL